MYGKNPDTIDQTGNISLNKSETENHPPATSTPFRIAFNLCPYTGTRNGGMLFYALSLLNQFRRMIPDNIIVFLKSGARELAQNIDRLDSLNHIQVQKPEDFFRYRDQFDVFFTPSICLDVNMLDYPNVNALPDIQEQYYPQFFCKADLDARRRYYTYAAKASTTLITISEYSKRTIVEKFQIPDHKVQVTYLGIHPIFRDESQQGVRPDRLPDGLSDFLFYPSNSWFHKNHTALLDAIVTLREKGIRIPVVFSGNLLTGEFNHVDIPKLIHEKGLEDQVFHIERVSLPELKYLYLNAAGLVHPSLFEGFGIPLVEAMSCGCPIIASDRTSIPEIAGDAALYFNPEDPADIASKITLFLQDSSDTRDRVERGRLRARAFTNEAMAEKTIQILAEAYDRDSHKSLRFKAARLVDRHWPIVTNAYFFKSFPKNEILSEISKVGRELNGRVQNIFILPGNLSGEIPAGFEVIRSGSTFNETLSGLTKAAKGEYLFFSGGRSVPLPSFVDYLAVNDPAIPSILEGDSYMKPVYSDCIKCDIPVGLTEEQRKRFFCSNLSFVVRSSDFRDLIQNSQVRFDSLPDMANRLWSLLPREQVFRTVSMNIEKNGENGDTPIGRPSESEKKRSPLRAIFARLFSFRTKSK